MTRHLTHRAKCVASLTVKLVTLALLMGIALHSADATAPVRRDTIHVVRRVSWSVPLSGTLRVGVGATVMNLQEYTSSANQPVSIRVYSRTDERSDDAEYFHYPNLRTFRLSSGSIGSVAAATAVISPSGGPGGPVLTMIYTNRTDSSLYQVSLSDVPELRAAGVYDATKADTTFEDVALPPPPDADRPPVYERSSPPTSKAETERSSPPTSKAETERSSPRASGRRSARDPTAPFLGPQISPLNASCPPPQTSRTGVLIDYTMWAVFNDTDALNRYIDVWYAIFSDVYRNLTGVTLYNSYRTIYTGPGGPGWNTNAPPNEELLYQISIAEQATHPLSFGTQLWTARVPFSGIVGLAYEASGCTRWGCSWILFPRGNLVKHIALGLHENGHVSGTQHDGFPADAYCTTCVDCSGCQCSSSYVMRQFAASTYTFSLCSQWNICRYLQSVIASPLTAITRCISPRGCGDGICTSDETVDGCPGDCNVCGNGRCLGTETEVSCPIDCTPIQLTTYVFNATQLSTYEYLVTYNFSGPNGRSLVTTAIGTVVTMSVPREYVRGTVSVAPIPVNGTTMIYSTNFTTTVSLQNLTIPSMTVYANLPEVAFVLNVATRGVMSSVVLPIATRVSLIVGVDVVPVAYPNISLGGVMRLVLGLNQIVEVRVNEVSAPVATGTPCWRRLSSGTPYLSITLMRSTLTYLCNTTRVGAIVGAKGYVFNSAYPTLTNATGVVAVSSCDAVSETAYTAVLNVKTCGVKTVTTQFGPRTDLTVIVAP